MKLGDAWKNTALLSVAILVSFLLAELLFAVFGFAELKQDTLYRQKDAVFHHSFVPNSSGVFRSTEFDVSYSISSLGFRDREYSLSKPQGTFRILVLGDSFTEGYGVDSGDSFSKQLESMLNKGDSSVKYEVVNAGVASYSPILEYMVVKYKGLALQPDMVILNFDWSDPNDDYVYSRLAVLNGSDVVAVPAEHELHKPFIARVRLFLSRHSRVYQFFAMRFAPATSDIVPGALGSDRLIFLRDNLTGSDYGALFNNSVPYLFKMRQLLQQNDVPFVIHIYPYALQLSTEAWKGGRGAFIFNDDKVFPIRPFDIMKAFGRENNITVVSSYGYFSNRSDLPLLYFDYDGHFTAEGHKVVATALYDFIQNSTIVSNGSS